MVLFLIHSRADAEAARMVKRSIESSPDARAGGIEVWLYVEDGMRPGAMDWRRQIGEVTVRVVGLDPITFVAALAPGVGPEALLPVVSLNQAVVVSIGGARRGAARRVLG